MVLALCMVLAMIPGQALAVDENDPTTWPAPDSQYTAPGFSPVYLFLDLSRADRNYKIRTNHSGCGTSTLNHVVVKATGTTDGYVKDTCRVCGSWAQVDVPAMNGDVVDIADAYKSIMANGVEYDGQPHSVYLKLTPT